MGQPDKGQELERVLASATDKPHVILLGGHPDPDGIGSALAHKRLCERLGVSATIAHVLPLSRSENRALVKLLNVPMVRVAIRLLNRNRDMLACHLGTDFQGQRHRSGWHGVRHLYRHLHQAG